MEPVTVGIREFRTRLAEYILKIDKPIAVTRHGQTVGYFIPARAARVDLDRASLKEAAAKMEGMLERAGFTESQLDEVTRDFRAWRKTSRK
jgi:PHD/YefM family antitoxin component YafN of YafNO toxin-antitoxin module